MCECVFDNGTNCVALNEKKCDGCKFRKTEEELAAGRKRAMDRINNLPHEHYDYIHEKYHKTK